MSVKQEAFTEKINQYLGQIDFEKKPGELYHPVAYCLNDGGKRIRPLMTLLACDMFGGNIDDALPCAAGMEIFHNFTLMHDDIMDEAPLRRGKPSVYKKWNINTAILSGDVMFAIAVQQLAKTPVQQLKPVLDLFNQTVIEVCEGQQYDMNFESIDNVSEDDYLGMIRLKTAVLPAACLKAGAVIAGAGEADADLLYNFGVNVGLAFQIMDDWLDIFGDEAAFGKKSGGDIVANKKTWLYIKAFELANESQLRDLRNAFTNRIYNTEEKISTVKHVYLHEKLDKLALEKMEIYNRRAFDFLDAINVADEKKEELRILAHKLLRRKI
jgi:geranylgeranyl diphosphate synthase, type II